jgi:hypothetical protein
MREQRFRTSVSYRAIVPGERDRAFRLIVTAAEPGDEATTAARSDLRCCLRAMSSGEVERQQIGDVGIWRTLRQFGQDMQEVCIRLDVAGPAREHEAVDHRACLRTINRIAKKPGSPLLLCLVHSAHIGREAEVHCRWHPLYGRRVKVRDIEHRGGGQVVHIEADDEVKLIAGWMLDAAADHQEQSSPD